MITYNYISEVVINRDFALLKQLKDKLSAELKLLNTFFDEYLEANLLDMKKESTNWVVYKEKLNEYSKVVDSLKSIDYFMEKYNV